MELPGLRDWLFSVKTFAGAMLALWVAFRLNLDRPYWAMATAYIVAQPLSGAMRSKAAYRFGGTVLGATAALILVPNLVSAPELLTAALSLWVGACIYFAILDRTPRSYVFLLAGFSAPLIGFPSVDAPGAIWDTVIARVEEITLGVVCTTLIGSLVFPRPLGPALTARIDAWLESTAGWSIAALSGHSNDAAIRQARQQVAGSTVEIGLLASQLAFDTSNLQMATRPVALLQERVVLLLPLLSGIGDRVAALHDAGGLTGEMNALLDRLAEWIGNRRTADLAEADRLRAEFAALQPAINARSDWNTVMLAGLLVRLRELTDQIHDIIALRRQIATGQRVSPDLVWAPAKADYVIHYRDHVMALHSAFAAALATGLVSAFWIGAGWPDGAGAASFAAVACSFFAALDDPTPGILRFLSATVIALAIDAVYLFAILPLVHSFEMLVLVMAPTFLLLGVFAGRPATAASFGIIAFLAATQLALSASYDADFASFTNGGIATIVGLGTAAILIRIFRSVGAEWTAERLLRANRIDIADAALERGTASRLAFTELLLDRLSLVVPRLAASPTSADAAATAALADLRVGLNIVGLRRDAAALPAASHHAIDAMLDGVAAHYRHRAHRTAVPALRRAIDRAIAAVTCAALPEPCNLLLALVGIRHALFPAGPPYIPESEPAPALNEAT